MKGTVGLRDFMESGGLDWGDVRVAQKVTAWLVRRLGKGNYISIGKNIRDHRRGIWFNVELLTLEQDLLGILAAHQEIAARHQAKGAKLAGGEQRAKTFRAKADAGMSALEGGDGDDGT